MRHPAAQGKQDRNAPAINKAAEQMGVCVVRTHMIGGGTGDAIWQWYRRVPSRLFKDVALEPRTVYVEIKTAKGKQSEQQKAFERQWRAAGGEYQIIRSLDDAVKLIQGGR